MGRKGSWFLGIGCLIVLIGIGFMLLLGRLLTVERVPSNAILAIDLQGQIAEVSTNDALSEVLGESSLSLRGLRKALVSAAQDDRIRGVELRVDGFGGGFAVAQELRSLLKGVHRAGKWTAAYMDTAGEFAPGNIAYFVASGCDEVSMNSMGDVNLIGLSVRSPFVRGTFDKLGIKPDFPGRGAYKTARFMYTQKDFTPAHKEMMEWLLDSLTNQLVSGVAESRGLEPAKVRQLIDRAPFMGQEAVDAGLVDRLEDWDDFRTRLRNKDQGGSDTIHLNAYLKGLPSSGSGPRIAVVTAVGAIMRGESRRDFNPLLGGEIMGSETIARAWRRVRKAHGIKAAIFRIDSPGGSAVASEIIRQEMARTAAEIPVVVSMSNVAGSGGYWITCGAQKIVADPGTLTASIGVFAGHLNEEAFWRDKLGVTFGKLDRGENADIYGGLQDWTDEQRAVINRMLDRIYGDFVSRVAKSRHMTPEQVDAVGRGRVFTAQQAVDKGLVDALGGFDVALAQAKQLAGISPETAVRLVDFPKPVPFWQKLLRRRLEDGAAVRAASQELQQWLQGGTIRTPGVAWMPPVYVQ